MLKIVDIGEFECDRCKDKRKKPGVELQTYGFSNRNPGTPEREEGKIKVDVTLHVWREQAFLCTVHLAKYIEYMVNESPWLWLVHQQAAMRKDYVNTTYEEAKKNGWA